MPLSPSALPLSIKLSDFFTSHTVSFIRRALIVPIAFHISWDKSDHLILSCLHIFRLAWHCHRQGCLSPFAEKQCTCPGFSHSVLWCIYLRPKPAPAYLWSADTYLKDRDGKGRPPNSGGCYNGYSDTDFGCWLLVVSCWKYSGKGFLCIDLKSLKFGRRQWFSVN
ncbi:MAG: hypothetical protein BROFUL_01110 [Candidatus Brocadia fulgida]|uniref:Uncharacterized protein n=1 Tax=Candidatus Brocadia fulgida TaxID=380242 RepID=A0A0M2UYV6_9BACT|nr:MAG: hypothetical protein BROFUL_01110 [Candidatus Brocadia fulgida]